MAHGLGVCKWEGGDRHSRRCSTSISNLDLKGYSAIIQHGVSPPEDRDLGIDSTHRILRKEPGIEGLEYELDIVAMEYETISTRRL